MNLRMKEELEGLKTASIIAWFIGIGLWLISLGINVIWFYVDIEGTLFVLSIVVLVSTGVCIIPFTYAAYKLGKE